MSYKIESTSDIVELKQRLDDGKYVIESRTRLEATVDGKPIAPATSEYFLGENQRIKMSKHILTYRGEDFKQKCSGLVVATGSGSTGWYSSINGGEPIEPTENKAVWAATEISSFSPDCHDGEADTLVEGEELIVRSMNHSDGRIVSDSWAEEKFPFGSTAVIKIGKPLNVVLI